MSEKHWIAGAVKHHGALRNTAKRMGLISGDQPLSRNILGKIEARSRDKSTAKRVNLAKTLLSMHGH